MAAYSAGNLFAGSRHGDGLWLFSLNGTLGEATEGDAIEITQVEDTPADVEVVFAGGEPDLTSGGLLYRHTCLR